MTLNSKHSVSDEVNGALSQKRYNTWYMDRAWSPNRGNLSTPLGFSPVLQFPCSICEN